MLLFYSGSIKMFGGNIMPFNFSICSQFGNCIMAFLGTQLSSFVRLDNVSITIILLMKSSFSKNVSCDIVKVRIDYNDGSWECPITKQQRQPVYLLDNIFLSDSMWI